MQIKLPMHSYRHSSGLVGVERLVNAYAEAAPPEGKAPVAVMRAPGISSFADVGSGPGRGLYTFKGSLYAVSGPKLYKVSEAGGVSEIGAVSGSDVVSFAENPTQLVVCSSAGSYYSDGASVTKISDADFVDGAQCTAIDGYIAFRKKNSGQWFTSDLNNAASYDALNFATAEGMADNIVGIIADHRQVVLMGAQSAELWYNAGTSGFSFERDSNGFIELGCASGATLAKADNTVMWLASDLTVRRLDGITPVRISTHAIEQEIKKYTVSDAYAFSYTDAGHILYVLTFPTSGATWVYDATTQEWHERETYGLSRWRPCSSAAAYGKIFFQDYETGKVGFLDSSVYTEWGETQRVETTFPSVYNNHGLINHATLEIVVETGVGLSTGQGSDPQMTLERSDDGGRTWKTHATKSMGKVGEYRKRVKWDRLGQARDRVYRISVSDPVKFVIVDAQLEAY